MEFRDPYVAITEKVQTWVDANPTSSHRERKAATERIIASMGIKLLTRGSVVVVDGAVELRGWSVDPRRWLGLPTHPITAAQARKLQAKGARS